MSYADCSVQPGFGYFWFVRCRKTLRWSTNWTLYAKSWRTSAARWVTWKAPWASIAATRECRPSRYCDWSRRRPRTRRWSARSRSIGRWRRCRRSSCSGCATSCACRSGTPRRRRRRAPRSSAASRASRRRPTTRRCGRSPTRSRASSRPSTGRNSRLPATTALKPMTHSPENIDYFSLILVSLLAQRMPSLPVSCDQAARCKRRRCISRRLIAAKNAVCQRRRLRRAAWSHSGRDVNVVGRGLVPARFWSGERGTLFTIIYLTFSNVGRWIHSYPYPHHFRS